MIKNELPATRLLGSVGADVITPAFSCFVSTCRSLLSRSCSSLVFDGTPPTKLRGRIFWAGKPSRQTRIELHISLALALDQYGNEGMSLSQAIEEAYRSSEPYGVVKSADW